jgi:hypothetical protein
VVKSEGENFRFDEVEIENEYSKLHSEKSSNAIKILSVLGGFLATLAFLGFMMIAGLYDSEVGMVITGILSIGFAIWLNVRFFKLIIDTLSVSAYAIGFSLLATGLSYLEVDENIIGILFIVIALITLAIMQNYILSFISILISNGGLLFLIINNDLYYLIHIYNAFIALLLTYVFLNEAKLISGNKLISKLYNPVRIGLLISLLTGLVFVGKTGIFENHVYAIWASSIITIPVTIYVISIIAGIMGVTEIRTKILIYTLCTLILIPTAFSPAVSGALLIILLSFLVNYKIGVSIGIISFIYFISQYYYDLNFTLLTKSILMFSTGIIFLLFYFFTYNKLKPDEEI